MPSEFTKDPDGVLNYVNNWADWLNGDSITSSTWTPDSGITVDSSDFDETTAWVILSGGTAGQEYEVVNHIVTAAGLEDDRTITITVAQK